MATDSSKSPVLFLRSLFPPGKARARGPCMFTKPSDARLAAYNMEAVTAIRQKKVDKLRDLFSKGTSFDGCNLAGESLLHLACRRSDLRTVQFLIEEANVPIATADDMGRTPLHDACWRPSPCTEIVDALLQASSPELLLAEDVRGHSCFDYVRKADWHVWVKFLQDRRSEIVKRTEKAVCIDSSEEHSVATSVKVVA